MEDAVICRADACCSVRWARSLLPAAICELADATCSALPRTSTTMLRSCSCMAPSARSSWPSSSRPPLAMALVRWPRATFSASRTALRSGATTARVMSQPMATPATAATSISARLNSVARLPLLYASSATDLLWAAMPALSWDSSSAGSRSTPRTAMSPTEGSKPVASNLSRPTR